MKKFRNILAMLMVFVMLVAVMPMNVFAEEEGEDGKPIEISNVNITSNIKDIFVVGKPAATPTLKADNVTIADFKWFKDGETSAYSGNFEDGVNYRYSFTITANEGFKLAETPTVKVDDTDLNFDSASNSFKSSAVAAQAATKPDDNTDTDAEKLAKAKKEAKDAVDKLASLSQEDKDKFKDKIDKSANKDDVDKVLKEATDKANPTKPTPAKTVNVVTIGKGTASVDKPYATYLDTVTVTATPSAGYVVSRIYYRNNKTGVESTIKNYGNGYYYGYRGKYYDGYYGDYYRYYSDYENNYYHDYSSYDAYLKDRHYSFWNNGYRYWDDYDYKYYNRYYDRYNDRYYDAYDSDYYRYYDDYVDNYYRRYSSYEDYLYDKHYSHYRDYRYYDGRYYNRYYYDGVNYTVNNTFTMPASDDVTVYVEFTDWSYYGYYYDDYYYYRYHRDKKDKVKEEKEEEEKKPVEEKTPQVFEASATINVGSKVFTKVNKNVTTTHQMDVAAYVKNGRVMLPLRYVAEALGLQVSWVPQTKTVIIWDLTQRVEIPIKSNKMIVNGVTYTSDVKPEIKNSRTMLPIANIARALGLVDGSDIIWDPVMKQVKLTRRVLSK